MSSSKRCWRRKREETHWARLDKGQKTAKVPKALRNGGAMFHQLRFQKGGRGRSVEPDERLVEVPPGKKRNVHARGLSPANELEVGRGDWLGAEKKKELNGKDRSERNIQKCFLKRTGDTELKNPGCRRERKKGTAYRKRDEGDTACRLG